MNNKFLNYHIDELPSRIKKHRESGITMVMDRELPIREAEDLVEVSGNHVNGWSNSYLYPRFRDKIRIYKSNDIDVYFADTLFELFISQGKFDDYRRLSDNYRISLVEVTGISEEILHDQKCEYINKLSNQFTVVSEVLSENSKNIIITYKWIDFMKLELEAGSWKFIGEPRESGNVGLFMDSREVRYRLVQEMLNTIPSERIIWELPKKTASKYGLLNCSQLM